MGIRTKTKKSLRALLTYLLTLVMLFGALPMNAIAQAVNNISVDYTVFVWVEKPNVSGDPGTNMDNYMFHRSVPRTGNDGRRAGTMADYTGIDAVNALPRDARTFAVPNGGEWAVFNHGESVEVCDDGTTIVNVFFRRLEFTFEFDLNPGASNDDKRRAASMVFGDSTFEQGVNMYDGNQLPNQVRYSFNAKYEQNIWHLWPSALNTTMARTRRVRISDFWGNITATTFRDWGAPSNIGAYAPFVSHRPTVTADMVPSGTGQNRMVIFPANWGRVSEKRVEYWFEALPGQTAMMMTFNDVQRGFVESQYSQQINIQEETLDPRAFTGLTHVGNDHNGNTSRFFYSRNRNDVSFYTGLDADVAPITDVMFGEIIAAKVDEIPTKNVNGDEYKFIGWYLEPGLNTPLDDTPMPNGPIMLFAKWESTEGDVLHELTENFTPTDDINLHAVQERDESRLDKNEFVDNSPEKDAVVHENLIDDVDAIPEAPTVTPSTGWLDGGRMAAMDDSDDDDILIEIADTPIPLVPAIPETEPELEPETETDADDEEETLIVIKDTEVPLAPSGNGQSWALLNLILSILGTALAFMMGIRAMIKKRYADEEQFEAECAEHDDEKDRRGRLALILAIPLLAIAGIVLFVFMQDMRNPMVMTDWWTLAHAILLLGGILCYIFAYGKDKGEGEDSDDDQPLKHTA